MVATDTIDVTGRTTLDIGVGTGDTGGGNQQGGGSQDTGGGLEPYAH